MDMILNTAYSVDKRAQLTCFGGYGIMQRIFPFCGDQGFPVSGTPYKMVEQPPVRHLTYSCSWSRTAARRASLFQPDGFSLGHSWMRLSPRILLDIRRIQLLIQPEGLRSFSPTALASGLLRLLTSSGLLRLSTFLGPSPSAHLPRVFLAHSSSAHLPRILLDIRRIRPHIIVLHDQRGR